MIKELHGSEGHVLGIKITGKISLEIEREWIARCDKIIKGHGRICLMVFLDYTGIIFFKICIFIFNIIP